MTAQAIGSLYAQLGLDSAKFDTGLAKARGKLGEFGKTNFSKGIKAGLGEIESGLSGLNGSLGAAGGLLSGLGLAGVAAGAAIAASFAGARDAMAFGDEIADTANKLKVSTDYLQEMRFAAHQLGGEFEDADAALEGFTKTFGLATSGLSAKALKPFTALGLDPKDFHSVQDALTAVIDKISKLGSAAEQAAVADKLGLTPLLPAIREGSATIDAMRKSAQDLGYVMDSELIEKAGDANDQYEALSAVLDVKFKSAMAEAIPLVMELTGWMVSGATAAGDLAGKLNDVAEGFAAQQAQVPDWLQGYAKGALKLTPFAIGFGNLGKMIDALGKGGRENRRRADFAEGSGALADRLGLDGGDPLGVLGDTSAALVDLKDKEDKENESRRSAAEAARAAQAAERKRLDGLLALNEAMRGLEQRSADYAASLVEEITTMGLSSKQLKEREMAMQIAAAPTEALRKTLTGLRDQYVAQTKVGEDWAKVQKVVNDQLGDTIATMHDAVGVAGQVSSTWEGLAIDAEKLAARSRDLSYAVEDIAYAINNHDWVSAFASLAGVLAKVEAAFKSAKTAKEKYNAVATVAGAVGSAIGGTAGSAISGAAAGAQLGTMIAPGIGTAIGAVLGGLGGLFGSSKAKKRAKAEAEAQRQAEEARRQQEIANTKRQIEIDLLRAQGKEVEAVALERQTELEALTKLDASLAAQKQAYYDAADAAEAKAKAEALAAQVTEKRQAIQDAIDKLTMSSTELLAKKRAAERDEAVKLDPALGDLIDRLFGLEDSAEASEKATAALQAANDSATRAAEQQATAMQGLADAVSSALSNLDQLTASLNDFGDTLGRPDFAGLKPNQAYASIKNALNQALAAGAYDLVQSLGESFLEASKAVNGASSTYIQDRAYVQAIAYSAAAANRGKTRDLATAFAGLRGFAGGGDIVIGGNTGLDQNLLSINGAPVARVNYGETLAIRPAGLNDNGSPALISEVRGLRAEVSALRASNDSIDRSTGESRRLLDRVTEGGQHMLTEAAS